MNLIVNSDLEILYKKIAETLTDSIKNLQKDRIVLGLCGGRSVAGVLKYLEANNDVDWSKIHIFLIDERCVAIDNPESNFKLIKDNFSKGSIHPFLIDRTEADFGIKNYQNEFENFGNKFDIILLSMGEDGHVGALYPNLSILNETNEYFYLDNSPKPPAQRTTASKMQMLSAQTAILMIIGDSKSEAYRNFNDERIDEVFCPAKIVKRIQNGFVFTNL